MPTALARSSFVARWIACALWAALAVSVGPLLRDAFASSSTASRVTAEVLAWVVWAVGLGALLLGRTRSIGVLRIAAPIAAGATVSLAIAAWDASPGLALLAIAHAIGAAGLALSGIVSRACAQGDAYGDEARFPLRVPPALLLAPIPLAVGFVALTGLGGPLLLAAGHVALGIGVLVVGLPLSFLAVRSVVGTAARVAVFVPAGLTIVDGFTLAMPLHLPRREVAGVHRAERGAGEPEGTGAADATIDLRVAAPGTVVVDLARPVNVVARRGRTRAESATVTRLALAPVQAPEFVAVAAARRVGQTASAPPSNTSFS